METEKFNPTDVTEGYLYFPALIVMKGLPCTAKTDVANQIGRWANCPVLSINDLLEDEYEDGFGSRSWAEAERLQSTLLQRAFASLCRIARYHLENKLAKAVVIKSRFFSEFELQQVINLFHDVSRLRVLIVECEMRNKHHWKKRFDSFEWYPKKWFRPRSWIDIENCEYESYVTDWYRELIRLMDENASRLGPPPVRCLQVDPYTDLGLLPNPDHDQPNPIFCHAINYLLTATPKKLNWESPYMAEFDEFRRTRANQLLNARISPTRPKAICRGGCLFKYLEEDRENELDGCRCELCEEEVVNSAAYTCHLCILTFHKSCVDLIQIYSYLHDSLNYLSLRQYLYHSPGEKHACNACSDTGEGFDRFCSDCRFRTFLKRRVVPPVVRHEHHPHPLSLTFIDRFVCKACSKTGYESSYVCKVCEWYCHLQCIYMPRELEHGHGGHEHVLKLKDKQDEMEREDYWCDVCYQDIDPYFWFYSCQTCPYYAAHLNCGGVYPRQLWEPRVG